MERKHQTMETYNFALTLKNHGESRKDISLKLNVSLSTLDNWFYLNKQPFVSRPYAKDNLGKYAISYNIYPENIDKYELAYLLGTLYSDGCSSRGFKLTVIDKDFIIANKIIIDKLLNINVKIKNFNRKNIFGKYKYNTQFYEINIVRKKLKIYLEKHKLKFKTKKEILYFVSGFFDGDGSINLTGNASGTISLGQQKIDILETIQILLNKINIPTNIRYQKNINMHYLYINKKEYMFQLYKYGNISIKRKRDKIKFILLNGSKKYKLEDL